MTSKAVDKLQVGDVTLSYGAVLGLERTDGATTISFDTNAVIRFSDPSVGLTLGTMDDFAPPHARTAYAEGR